MSNTSLAAVILTKNERAYIRGCIASLSWADRVVVFDSLSDDGTPELAAAVGAEVMQHPFVNYAQQRNAALDLVEAEWIFFVDADERATPELAQEVRDVIAGRSEVGWWVPRRNIIVGKWIEHTGWYPDYQLRLLRRSQARYDPQREVHELVLLDGQASHLQHTLTHYNYETWTEFIEKQQRYLRYDARMQWAAGVRPKPWTYVLQPLREFRRRFITLQGYRDGRHGFILSALMAYTALLTTLEVRKLPRRASH